MKRFLLNALFNYDRQQKQTATTKLSLDSTRYNFGVSGHTKTGKSTLVNTFLGRNRAETDVTEATHLIAKYDITTIPNATLWDLPGCGTEKHSAENYFENELLYVFDLVIIVVQEQITPEEFKLAAESYKRGQPVIFVRSKCDLALYNEKAFGNITEINQDVADEFVKKSLLKSEFVHLNRRYEFLDLIQFEKDMADSKIQIVENPKIFFISSLVLHKKLNGVTPECCFQEKEFLREIYQAAVCKREKEVPMVNFLGPLSTYPNITTILSNKNMVWCVVGACTVTLLVSLWRRYGSYFDYLFSSQTIDQANEKLGIQKNRYNIGVVGRGITGRTKLLEVMTGNNGIRNFESGVKYESSRFPNATFWEPPKFNHNNVSEYYNQHYLFRFDLIIVVCQATLGEDEIKLLSEAKQLNLPVILVRSRCDTDFRNQHSFYGNGFALNQEAANLFVNDLKAKFAQQLSSSRMSNIQTFFISALILQKVFANSAPDFCFEEKEFEKYLKSKIAEMPYHEINGFVDRN